MDNKNNNQIDEVNKENGFSLPSGCMVTKREIRPMPVYDEVLDKNTRKKTKKSAIAAIIAVVIICIVLCCIYKLPKIKKAPETSASENITTSNDLELTATNGDGYIATGSDIVEEKTTESIPIHNLQSEKEETDITEEEFSDNKATTEYDEFVDTKMDGIVIGGLVVTYGFDATWNATIKDGKYEAIKEIDSNYVKLTVKDSNISVGNRTECIDYLSIVENPFKTDGKLSKSNEGEEIVLNGKVCYYTSYTGITAESNTYTTIGIMQDFGGETYAIIIIEDTIGYSVDNLIQSLCIN